MRLTQKKFYLVNLGCVKNQVDGEIISGFLLKKGYLACEYPKAAEIIIINSCAFIREAKNETIESIFNLVQYKKTGICKKVILCGCFAQRYYNEIKAEKQYYPTKGWLAEDVLNTIMGVETSRNVEIETKINRLMILYEKRIKENISKKEEKELADISRYLNDSLPTTDPILTLLQLDTLKKYLGENNA